MAIKQRAEHAVWDVYDRYRTARLSCKYYGARVAKIERSNFVIELLLAFTASGSAVAAFAFWKTQSGQVMWTVLTTTSAVLAVVKPLLKLGERIQKFEELSASYSALEHGYSKLVVTIKQRGTFGPEAQQQLRMLMDSEDDVRKKEVVERKVNEKLRRECREAVERELPNDHFFIPEVN